MLDNIQKYAKAIVAFVGAFLTAGSTFIPAEWSPWVSLALALLTTVATFQVPNRGVSVPGKGDALVAGDGLGGPEHSA